MENLTSNGVDTQGVETQEVPDVKTILRWMDRDLGASISFLKAIYDDPAVKAIVAEYLRGRIENWKNKPDPAQTDLFNSKNPKPGK